MRAQTIRSATVWVARFVPAVSALMTGTLVGAAVGAPICTASCAAVDVSLGTPIGTAVGAPVGTALGTAVGVPVGAADAEVTEVLMDDGTGWVMTMLDLEVSIERDPPSMKVTGRARLRLESARSTGPSLAVNAYESPMRWRSVEASEASEASAAPGVPGVLGASAAPGVPGARGAPEAPGVPGASGASGACGATSSFTNDPDPDSPETRLAHIRLEVPATRGDELVVDFELALAEAASQLLARDDIALASWVHAWYPVPVSEGSAWGNFTARSIAVPGTTTFDLPDGWSALTDGTREWTRSSGGRTQERWTLGEFPVARSFVAGPYHEAIREVGGRTIRIYLRGDHPIEPDRLASLLGRALEAEERRLGPFPFAGYGVAEVPDGMEGWSAASQQTFIMAESQIFEYEHGNLPLWAHEMTHGWWGNTVGSTGPGDKMAGEALAQLGVLIALEEIEGKDAMTTFLEESRSGYSPLQCARGYFRLVDKGIDHPLATLGTSELNGGQTHSIVNSKGMWVWHMLRRRIGDERFFGTLREVVETRAGDRITLDELRQLFAERAPEADLPHFFETWLDRTGAPRIHAAVEENDGPVLVLTQEGDPFELDLTVAISREDGTEARETVHLLGPTTRVGLPRGAAITEVTLDPDRDLLLWREAYRVEATEP